MQIWYLLHTVVLVNACSRSFQILLFFTQPMPQGTISSFISSQEEHGSLCRLSFNCGMGLVSLLSWGICKAAGGNFGSLGKGVGSSFGGLGGTSEDSNSSRQVFSVLTTSRALWSQAKGTREPWAPHICFSCLWMLMLHKDRPLPLLKLLDQAPAGLLGKTDLHWQNRCASTLCAAQFTPPRHGKAGNIVGQDTWLKSSARNASRHPYFCRILAVRIQGRSISSIISYCF